MTIENQENLTEAPVKQSQAGKSKSQTGILIWVVIVGISIAQGVITSADTLFNYIYSDSYKFNPGTATQIAALVGIPWSLKPIWGAITDSFPIFGYRRKSYIFLTCVVAWLGLSAYTLSLPPAWLGVLAIVAVNFGQSFQSVLGQAIIVENTQIGADGQQATEEEKEEATSRGVTVYINGRLVGRLLISLLLAVFLTETNYLKIVFILSFVPIAVLVLSFILKEKRAKKNAGASFISANPKRSMAVVDKKENMRKFWKFVRHPLIFKSWMFIFFSSFQISSDQASFYYYTKFLKFEANTYATVQTISVGATIVGITCYYWFFKNVSMKKFYTVTLIFVIAANLFMLILYFRLNVQWGISDFLMVVLDTFITAIVVELNSVPIWTLAAQLCPKGLEATVYAFMLAGSNLSSIISAQIGGYILDWLYITDTNFDNMWILAIISATTPLLSLYFVATVPFEDAIKVASDYADSEVDGEGSFLEIDNEKVIASHGVTEEGDYKPPVHVA